MVDTAENIFRDFVTDGVPASGTNKPKKSKIREWGKWLEDQINAGLSNGGLIYDTKANLNADLAHGANSSAWVVADSAVANNGIYRKSGASGTGSWTRIADLPYSFIRATDSGAGTANAIVATTSIPLPAGNGAALIALNIFENNTGAATVAFNGGSPLTIKTNSGANVQADYLVAGAIVAGYVSGSTFRLISDVGTAADRAAAEAAAAAASQSATDAANAAPTGFATVAAAEASSLTAAPDYIRTAGLDAAGDGYGSLFKKVGSEPDHLSKFSITLADGVTVVWYEDTREPVLIFVSGQSNAALRPAYSWTPPKTLFLWDFYGITDPDTKIGTSFASVTGNVMSLGLSFAAEYAKANPDKRVYLVEIAVGGLEIANWGTTPPDFDFRTCIENNMPVALSQSGADHVELMLWWQGEADAVLGTLDYSTQFDAWQTWLRTQTWWPYETPIILHGLSPYASAGAYNWFSGEINALVANDPFTRLYVYPGYFPKTDYWLSTGAVPYIHMLNVGYEIVGKLGYNTWANGLSRTTIREIVVNPGNGHISMGRDSNGHTIKPNLNEKVWVEWDQDANTGLSVSNPNTGSSAAASQSLRTTAGVFTTSLSGAAGTQQAIMQCTAAGGLLITTNHASGNLSFGSGVFQTRLTFEADGGIIFRPPSAAQTLSINGQVSLELTNDTTLKFRARGSDGTVRQGTVTLS